MEDARPSQEFVQRGGDLLVKYGVGVREKDGGVREAGVVGGDPVEIALAVGGEAEAFAPALGSEVESVFLAFEIEWEKGFDPFRGILRLEGIFGIGSRAADLDLFGENGSVVFVESEETLWEVGGDALLDLRGVRMDEAVAEGIARRLQLLRRLAIAVLMQKPSRAEDGDEQHKGSDQWAEGFDKQGLHQVMILDGWMKETKRIAAVGVVESSGIL